ncbi:MAG: right-handed parallel beta-helix repeat-containing protein [Gemmataceae bacterium]
MQAQETTSVDAICPCCSAHFAAHLPAVLDPKLRNLFDGEVTCPCCSWSFALAPDGTVDDDGDVEPEGELEVDAEGNLVDALDSEPFPPWHGIASLSRQLAGLRTWSEFRNDDAPGDHDEYEEESALDMRLVRAECPNCGHLFKQIWLGETHCPDCDWVFRIDVEMDYNATEPGRPSPAETRSLREGAFLPPIVVSATGHGRVQTIQQGVERATAGQRVLVRPGLYNESVFIEKRVDLRGDGPREEIVLTGNGARCLTVAHPEARVSGLTCRGAIGAEAALLLHSGIVEDCDLTGKAAACVRITGGRLTRCLIHDSKGAGVEATGGIIEDCAIGKHVGPGVLANDGTPVIRYCSIHNGRAQGILLTDQVMATIGACDITHNAGPGVEMRGKRARLWKTRIQRGRSHGVLLAGPGTVFLERCDIVASALNGVEATAGHLTAWKCRIHHGKQAGLRLASPGRHRMTGCLIYRNRIGIELVDGAIVLQRHNRILHNQH